MIAVKMRQDHPIEVARFQVESSELASERLMRLDVETSAGHATGRSGRATGVDENAFGRRLDDPRPHRQRLGKSRVACDAADQPERSAVGRASFEEGGLELQGSGGNADDAHGNIGSTVSHGFEQANETRG